MTASLLQAKTADASLPPFCIFATGKIGARQESFPLNKVQIVGSWSAWKTLQLLSLNFYFIYFFVSLEFGGCACRYTPRNIIISNYGLTLLNRQGECKLGVGRLSYKLNKEPRRWFRIWTARPLLILPTRAAAIQDSERGPALIKKHLGTTIISMHGTCTFFSTEGQMSGHGDNLLQFGPRSWSVPGAADCGVLAPEAARDEAIWAVWPGPVLTSQAHQ